MTRFNPETILRLAQDHSSSWEEQKKFREIVEICQEELKRLAILDLPNGSKLVRRYNAAKAYIKAIDDNRPGLKGAWYETFGVREHCQTLCNGYTAMFIYEPLEGLPEPSVPEENLLKVRNILTGIPSEYVKVEVDYPAVVAMTKGHGKYDKPIYGIGQQVFDPHMITDVVPILGEGCEFWSSGKDDYAPMYVTNDNGIAIVLPCRK